MSALKKKAQNLAIKTSSKKKLSKNLSFNGTQMKKPKIQRRRSIAIVPQSKTEVKPDVNKEISFKFEKYANEYNVKYDDVKKAIEGTIKFVKNNPKLKNTLFNENFPLYLQVNTVKVPDCYKHILRLQLEHSCVGPDDEICFIVPDVKGIQYKEYEKHWEHYENLLKQNGIENIKKIMTLHELKLEHETFEQMRRLVDLYDLFLVDGRISGKVVKKCGSIFYKKRKVPTSVRMFVPNLKLQFEKTLKKTSLYMCGKGASFAIQFGKSSMNTEEMIENVFKLLKDLDVKFPGNFKNIRSLVVFANRGLKIPIYKSLIKPNDVGDVQLKEKKPGNYQTVEGELSTRLNSNVVVTPEGQVQVKQIKSEEIKKEEEEEISFKEEIISENETDIKPKVEKTSKKVLQTNPQNIGKQKMKKLQKSNAKEETLTKEKSKGKKRKLATSTAMVKAKKSKKTVK